MGVQIDETGAHNLARSVDGPRSIQVGDVAPLHGDRVALDQHGGEEAGAAGAIDYQTVGDQ